MRIGDAMTREVETTRPSATLQEAAAQMGTVGVGMLPVVDDGRIVGVITDRDITVRAVARGVDPTKGRVGDAMSAPVVFVYEDETVRDAARRMEDHGVRRLLVLDRDERLVGVITLDDLATLPGMGEVLTPPGPSP